MAVLSNNDANLISRSDEIKQLGVKMGTPYFQCAPLLKRHNAILFSSNYTLYGDFSARTTAVYEKFTTQVDRYSIDESFLDMSHIAPDDRLALGAELRQTVRRWTGIPVCVGFGASKTLAKLANRLAKKNPALVGVCDLTDNPDLDDILATFPVEDVWGIGSRRAAFLAQHGITTAKQLRDAPDAWVKKHLTIVGLRTVWELRGVSCIPLELAPPPKKMIACTRSFGRPVTTLDDLREAVAMHAARAGEKLRLQGSTAHVIQVFISTSHFKADGARYGNTATVALAPSTSSSPALVAAALAGLKMIYRQGYQYARAGVLVSGLERPGATQLSLFGVDSAVLDRQAEAMAVLDKINRQHGRDTLRIAATGLDRGWQMRRGMLSPSYTTRWDDILIAQAV